MIISRVCCPAVIISGVLFKNADMMLHISFPMPAAECRFTNAGMTCRLREAVRHRNPRGFLQAENVLKRQINKNPAA